MKHTVIAALLMAATVGSADAYAQATKPQARTPASKSAAVPAAQKPAKPAYRRKLPASLMKEAKITESAAADLAKAAEPGATITEMALEKEAGKLIYSYDLKTAGKTGVDEVHIDAMTGAVIGTTHESPKQEKAEKSKAKKPATTPAKTKKP